MLYKDYYLLEETENRFNLSISDIRYLVEQEKLCLGVYVDRQEFVIGGWVERKFTGYGWVSYAGPVTLSRSDSLSILDKGRGSISIVYLPNRSRSVELHADYPFDLACPNNYVERWKPTPLKDIKWSRIPAKVWAQETIPLVRSLSEIFSGFATDEKKKAEYLESMGSQLRNTPKKILSPDMIGCKSEKLCVLHEDLHALGLIDSKSFVKSDLNSGPSVTTPKNRKRTQNRLHTLIENLVGLQPKKTPAQLWNYLKDFWETNDELDPESILCEVSDDVMIWVNSSGVEKTCKFKTFQNLVGKIRKK